MLDDTTEHLCPLGPQSGDKYVDILVKTLALSASLGRLFEVTEDSDDLSSVPRDCTLSKLNCQLGIRLEGRRNEDLGVPG